jgi:hypothetical protein
MGGGGHHVAVTERKHYNNMHPGPEVSEPYFGVQFTKRLTDFWAILYVQDPAGLLNHNICDG